MEIETNVILQLVAGQSRTEQAVLDLGKRFDKVITVLAQQDKDLEKRVRSVENKQWYFGGAGTILGAILTYAGEHIKFFGGK